MKKRIKTRLRNTHGRGVQVTRVGESKHGTEITSPIKDPIQTVQDDTSYPQEGVEANVDLVSVPVRCDRCGAIHSGALVRAVDRSGLTCESLVMSVTSVALGRLVSWSQLDLEMLLHTAERYGVDPVGGEIYAVPLQEHFEGHARSPGINLPLAFVLSVDGWCRVINAHPQFDGMNFRESDETLQDGLPSFIECSIFRRDRRAVTRIREYMVEVNTGLGAWLTHPRRMLRHKAMVQCARVCFGMGGVLEHDEAVRVHAARVFANATAVTSSNDIRRGPQGTEALREWLASRQAP